MLSAVGSVVSSAVCVTVSMGAPEAPADAESWVLQCSQLPVESVDLERAAVFAKVLATHNAPQLGSSNVKGAYEWVCMDGMHGAYASIHKVLHLVETTCSTHPAGTPHKVLARYLMLRHPTTCVCSIHTTCCTSDIATTQLRSIMCCQCLRKYSYSLYFQLLVFGILGGFFDVLGCLKYTMIKGRVCCRRN